MITLECLALRHMLTTNLVKMISLVKEGEHVFSLDTLWGKCYKLYDLKTLKIHITRDVTFVENVFPFDENYKGYKNVDNNSFAESINNAENFIKNYDPTAVFESVTGAVEDEPRKEVENRNDEGDDHVEKTVHNFPEESTSRH